MQGVLGKLCPRCGELFEPAAQQPRLTRLSFDMEVTRPMTVSLRDLLATEGKVSGSRDSELLTQPVRPVITTPVIKRVTIRKQKNPPAAAPIHAFAKQVRTIDMPAISQRALLASRPPASSRSAERSRASAPPHAPPASERPKRESLKQVLSASMPVVLAFVLGSFVMRTYDTSDIAFGLRPSTKSLPSTTSVYDEGACASVAIAGGPVIELDGDEAVGSAAPVAARRVARVP